MGEQVEPVKKKRKLVKGLPKFNQPKYINPPKQPPVAFMRTNQLAPTQTQTVIEPSASIHTTVHTGRSSVTNVAPSAKVNTFVQAHPNTINIVKPSAKVLTNVKTTNTSQTTVKPSADVSTTVNTSTHSKTYVKPYTIVKTVCEPILKSVPPKPSVAPTQAPRQTKSEGKKLDLGKVRRSGRNVWRTNANKKGPGKKMDDPIEIDNDCNADVQKETDSPVKVVPEANLGSCLGLLRKVDTIKYV
jgi:hypothetical protein